MRHTILALQNLIHTLFSNKTPLVAKNYHTNRNLIPLLKIQKFLFQTLALHRTTFERYSNNIRTMIEQVSNMVRRWYGDGTNKVRMSLAFVNDLDAYNSTRIFLFTYKHAANTALFLVTLK